MMTKMMTKLIFTLTTLFFLNTVEAKELKGVTMPDEIKVGDATLKLNCLGVRRAMGIFDVYVAGLYVAIPSKDPEEILKATTPKRLVMRFKRFVEKSKLKDAWQEGFENNASKEYSYKSDLLKLTDQMSHMQDKEEITYTFFQDRAEIIVKDKPVLTIPGAEFSNTLLKVFIGNPPDGDLKKGILCQLEK